MNNLTLQRSMLRGPMYDYLSQYAAEAANRVVVHALVERPISREII